MSRVVTLDTLRGMMAESTDVVPLIALTITHPDLTAPIRVVNNTEALVRPTSAVTAHDLSGNGLHLTKTGTVTWVRSLVAGNMGGAVKTPGTASNCLLSDTNVNLNEAFEVAADESLTLEAWVHREVDTTQDICGFFPTAAAGKIRLRTQTTGRVSAIVQDTGGTNDATINSANNLFPVDSTAHLAMVLNRSDDTLKIFLNGEEIGSVSAAAIGAITFPTDARFCVGAIGNFGASNPFQGSIDEVRFWKTARTAEQLRRYSFIPLNGKEPGLVADWSLDDGVFYGLPFNLVLPDDQDDEIPAVSLVIDNVDSRIGRALENLRGKPVAVFEVVNADTPEDVEAGPYEMSVHVVTVTSSTVEGQLSYEDILNQRFPKDTFTPQNSPGLF